MKKTIFSLDGADIKFYKNGILYPVDFTENNGLYSTKFNPISGDIYSIDVWKDGIKLLSACDTIPGVVLIENPIWQPSFGMMDEWTQAGLVSFSFSDDPLCKNFYEIMLARKSYKNDGLEYLACMEINNEFITSSTDRSWQDIKSFVFSDSLFQGKTVDIQIKVQSTFQVPPFIVLMNVSQSYYQYRRQWITHQFLQNRNREANLSFFKGEPVDMFTNINGGLGVFVAYNQDIKECQIIQ